MEFLTWLGQFFSQLFPPWEVVPKTHVGIRQRNLPLPAGFKAWADRQRAANRKFFWLIHYAPEHGVLVRDCGPGWVLKIPFIDEIWQLPVKLEAEDLTEVDAETTDGLVYRISPVLTWKVANPEKACFAVSNYEDSLYNAVRAIIVGWVNTQTGRVNVEKMVEECSREVRKIGADWGCFTQGVTFNSCACQWQRFELAHSLVPIRDATPREGFDASEEEEAGTADARAEGRDEGRHHQGRHHQARGCGHAAGTAEAEEAEP